MNCWLDNNVPGDNIIEYIYTVRKNLNIGHSLELKLKMTNYSLFTLCHDRLNNLLSFLLLLLPKKFRYFSVARQTYQAL